MICPATALLKEAFDRHPEGIKCEIFATEKASSLYVSLLSPQVNVAVWFNSYAVINDGFSVSVRSFVLDRIPSEKKDAVKIACIELSDRYHPLLFELSNDKVRASFEIPSDIENLGEYCYDVFYRISTELIFANSYFDYVLFSGYYR